MVQDLHWKRIEQWKTLGVYTDRPKLGPGGWSTYSYFCEAWSDKERNYAAYAYGSSKFFTLIFQKMIDDGIGMNGINMWTMRDRSANPNDLADVYAFFENPADGWIFHNYLADLDADEKYGSFFKFR